MNLNYFQRYWTTIFVYLVLAILVVVASMLSEVFPTSRNFNNILIQAIPIAFVSFGQTFVILTEGIDLSMGAVVSLTTCLTTGMILGRESLVVPVVALVIVLALFIGFCNGFLITRIGVSPLVTTLGMMGLIEGVALIYTNVPYGAVPESFYFIAWGKMGFIPFPVFLMGMAAVVGIIILKRTRFGRYVYATGGDEEIARLSGIKTHRVKIISYMICSFTAGLTGIFLASRMGMGDPLIGERYMLDSIVPVLIGGTSLSGGKGGLGGTIPGVFILAILANVLNLLGVSGWWNWIVEGIIIIIAVAFYWKEKE